MNHPKEEWLKQRVSELESINDQLVREIEYLDELLKELGFEEGIATMKQAALEIIEERERNDH